MRKPKDYKTNKMKNKQFFKDRIKINIKMQLVSMSQKRNIQKI